MVRQAHHEDVNPSERRASRRLCGAPPEGQCLAQRGFSASCQTRCDPRGKKTEQL